MLQGRLGVLYRHKYFWCLHALVVMVPYFLFSLCLLYLCHAYVLIHFFQARMERAYYDQVDNFSKTFNSLIEHLKRQSQVFHHIKLLLMNNEESMDQIFFLQCYNIF
ncbi:hypothetical protein ACP275_06G139800 [Erythranthe tilingii]